MKKLNAMAANARAAETQMTSPSQDANVWREFLVSAAHGLSVLYPDDSQRQAMSMKVFIAALEDGLNDRSKRSLVLAQRLQSSIFKATKEGQEGGGN